MKFAVIDFETANGSNASACSVGLCVIDNLEIDEKKYYLIKPPPSIFEFTNTDIHNITQADVADAPYFNEIWDEIANYFNGDYIIVAHNAQFDMSVLCCCLEHYQIPLPEFTFIDSVSLAKKIADYGSRRLDSIAHILGIDNTKHHNALNDAIVCAEIVIASLRDVMKAYVGGHLKQFSDLKPSRIFVKKNKSYPKVRYSSYTANTNADKSTFFYGKKIVATGNFKNFTKDELLTKLSDLGATVVSTVSSKTNCLVCGSQDLSVVSKDGKSFKEKRAEELIAAGHDIKIIKEHELYALLEDDKIGETV